MVRDVHLPRADANDGTVDLVELEELEGELPTQDYVVVELVVACQLGQPGSGDVGDGTQPRPLDAQAGSVGQPDA